MKRLIGFCLLVAAGCARCKGGSASTEPIDRVLPKTAIAVVVVPDLSVVDSKLKLVEGLKVASFAAALQGFADARSWSDAVVSQLGIDVRSKQVLLEAGLDPAKALAIVMLSDGSSVLVLPLQDEAKLTATLEKVGKARLGSATHEEKRVGSASVHQYLGAGSVPVLGYSASHGYALIATRDAVDKLGALAALKEEDSLVGDSAYQALLKRASAPSDARAYLPPGSPMLKAAMGSALAHLTLKPDAFEVTVDVSWKGDPQLLKALIKSAVAKPIDAAALPSDGFALVRFAGDAASMAALPEPLNAMPVMRALSEGGFDVRSEVFANLAPGAWLAFALAPTAKMDRGVPQLDIRRTNPFAYVHVAGAAHARDEAKLSITLDKLAQVAPRFGASIEKQDRSGTPIYLTQYSQGEGLSYAAKKDSVLFAAPKARLEAMLDGFGGAAGADAFDGELLKRLDGPALGLAIDLRKLSNAVRALPSSAWGIGGFAIKASTVRWLDATDDLRAISLGLSANDSALHSELVLKLGAAQGKGQVAQ